jgi:predicted GNAT superfamily acetyltransferase
LAGSQAEVKRRAAEIEIAPLDTQERIKAAVALQKQVWGFADIELLPVRLFVTAGKIGGQIFGAFDRGAIDIRALDSERLVGFCLAIPGVKVGGAVYLHSHMLAVADGYRDYGIGRRLKLRQREDALERGIGLMEWTFDPLEIKNAYFNIERLGAVVRRFTRNQYGTTSSHLHGGLPTDRCTTEWWMDSERVKSVLAGTPVDHGRIAARIEVPNEIAQIRADEPERARVIQAGVSEQFEKYFDQGLAVIGFEKTAATGNYLIGDFD